MSNMHNILEDIRRDMYDVAKDRIEEHGLKIISNSVKMHRQYGMQIVIIIQPPEEKNDGK